MKATDDKPEPRISWWCGRGIQLGWPKTMHGQCFIRRHCECQCHAPDLKGVDE